MGIRLGLVQAQEVAAEGGEFQVMEVCAEGLVPLPGVPSGSQNLFGEGDGFLADEESASV